jgi:hypothetical protein
VSQSFEEESKTIEKVDFMTANNQTVEEDFEEEESEMESRSAVAACKMIQVKK